MIGLQALELLAQQEKIDQCLLSCDAGLAAWPRVDLEAESVERFRHGNPLEHPSGTPGAARVYGPGNQLLGLGEIDPDYSLRPRRIMHLKGE
jgi:tRNA pseudouridine55 synthase